MASNFEEIFPGLGGFDATQLQRYLTLHLHAQPVFHCSSLQTLCLKQYTWLSTLILVEQSCLMNFSIEWMQCCCTKLFKFGC